LRDGDVAGDLRSWDAGAVGQRSADGGAEDGSGECFVGEGFDSGEGGFGIEGGLEIVLGGEGAGDAAPGAASGCGELVGGDESVDEVGFASEGVGGVAGEVGEFRLDAVCLGFAGGGDVGAGLRFLLGGEASLCDVEADVGDESGGRWRCGEAGVVPVEEEIGATKGFDAVGVGPVGDDVEPEFSEGAGEGVIQIVSGESEGEGVPGGGIDDEGGEDVIGIGCLGRVDFQPDLGGSVEGFAGGETEGEVEFARLEDGDFCRWEGREISGPGDGECVRAAGNGHGAKF